MGRSRLKTTVGIFSLFSSILFILLSPISFLILMINLAGSKYEYFSLAVFVYALYFFIVSIIMLRQFKSKKKAIRSTLRIIFSNIISVILYVLFIIKFASLEDNQATWGDIFILFLLFSSGLLFVYIGVFSMICSVLGVIISIIYLILIIKDTKKDEEITNKENSAFIKNEEKNIKIAKKKDNSE